MLLVCAFLPRNAPLVEDNTSATPVPVPRTISSAAPKPLVAVVAAAGGRHSATVPHCPISAQVRQISNAVFPNRLAGAEAEAEAEVEVLEIILRRPFQWLEHARRKQSMALGRLSKGTKVLSARFTAPGIAPVHPKTAITAAAWPQI